MGANIDAIETAGNIGIRRERAANFHNDHKGISHSYSAIGDAMCCFMSAGSISDSWKNSVDEDFNKRINNPFSKSTSQKTSYTNSADLDIDKIFGDILNNKKK